MHNGPCNKKVQVNLSITILYILTQINNLKRVFKYIVHYLLNRLYVDLLCTLITVNSPFDHYKIIYSEPAGKLFNIIPYLTINNSCSVAEPQHQVRLPVFSDKLLLSLD